MGRLTYTTQEVQDRLDSVGQMVRPNLLDNAYFIGGGSQGTAGAFPINQRGATAYNATGYTVDRWYVGINNAVTIGSDCLTITDQTGSHQNWKIFTQKIPNATMYRGKKFTMSVLCGDTVTAGLAKPLIRIESNGSYVNQSLGGFFEANGLATVTWTIPTSGTFDTIVAGVMETTTGTGAYKILAMKLEVGDFQTLAHWDEATQAWVLNEVPNFGEELARCERYYYAMPNYVRFPTTRWLSGEIEFLIPIPVTMRTTPTIVGTPVVYSGNTAQSGFTFTMTGMGNNALAVRASKASHGLTDEGVSLYVAGTALSADL